MAAAPRPASHSGSCSACAAVDVTPASIQNVADTTHDFFIHYSMVVSARRNAPRLGCLIFRKHAELEVPGHLLQTRRAEGGHDLFGWNTGFDAVPIIAPDRRSVFLL